MCMTLPIGDDLSPNEVRPTYGRSVDDGYCSGLPVLPTQVPGVVVDLELVNQLRDNEH